MIRSELWQPFLQLIVVLAAVGASGCGPQPAQPETARPVIDQRLSGIAAEEYPDAGAHDAGSELVGDTAPVSYEQPAGVPVASLDDVDRVAATAAVESADVFNAAILRSTHQVSRSVEPR